MWYNCLAPMTRKEVNRVILSKLADFFNGMSTAWTFAAVDSLSRLAWWDLLWSLFLAILSFSASVSIQLKTYVKRS